MTKIKPPSAARLLAMAKLGAGIQAACEREGLDMHESLNVLSIAMVLTARRNGHDDQGEKARTFVRQAGFLLRHGLKIPELAETIAKELEELHNAAAANRRPPQAAGLEDVRGASAGTAPSHDPDCSGRAGHDDRAVDGDGAAERVLVDGNSA